MIVAKALTREFASGDETVLAVDAVDLTLPDGVFAAVVGPSGSGKSTLLSLLGTLDMPTSGTIEIDGREVTTMSGGELTAYRRSRIGFVFQSYNLIPNLTAKQNVMLPLEFAGVASDARRERAEHLLEQVGLDASKQNRRPGRLSGGEQQRVAIARALANKPCLVLADEPTGNLDRENGATIVALLRELARSENTAILAVTHDPDVASAADVTFRLADGRLIDLAGFEGAVATANAAYERWTRDRDEGDLGALVGAVAEMLRTAPAGRRLSADKIRRRYADAAPALDEVLATLDSDDLFEDEG